VGYSDRKYPTEILRLHVSGSASTGKPTLSTIAAANGRPVAPKGRRKAWFSGAGLVDTPVFDGDTLLAGQSIAGPAIIEERFTTLVLPPGSSASVDQHGNFIATLDKAGKQS
jgi:N-methylhydantoinase A